MRGSPLGWTLLKEDRRVAMDLPAESAASMRDVAKLVAVPSDVRIAEPEQARKMEVQIAGIDFSNFELEGAGQRLIDPENGLVRIVMERPAAGAPLPIREASLAEFLKPTVLIQSDDAAILKLAQRIAEGETDSLAVADRINQWVFDNIHKKITFSLPSAVEVLDTREGDCNEHTTLYVALARAAGIPAKAAIGLVYHKGHFYYHAWPEVYVGQWIAMDPTLGQPLADATHIKLLEGELYQQAKLVQAIGKLKLSIKSVAYPPPVTPGKSI
ncbi:MAG: transglutaminase domain-containing protein [Candidatus Lindowbacteria bacterium]|nr:transglutaminase domain-containing protein [Candidatus Lindowbacteria bacterium]